MNGQDLFVGRDLAKTLAATAEEFGRELVTSGDALGEYIASRISHLKFASREPGYDEAVVAERDNVALFAAGKSVDEADKFDDRVLGLVEGALRAAVAAAA